MHYFEKETIMSRVNALELKPNEILVLGHVRTYEYEEESLLPFFVEIRCEQDSILVRKNKILEFPLFRVEKEERFTSTEAAVKTFRDWITEMD